jgi:hypothetical protein
LNSQRQLARNFTLRYKVNVSTSLKRVVAASELILVFPGALFMTALFFRNIQAPPYQPAEAARQVVAWFSARPRLGLDVFLIALPFTALVIGCITAVRSWRGDEEFRSAALDCIATIRAHAATLLVAVATVLAAGILGIVALHMITE